MADSAVPLPADILAGLDDMKDDWEVARSGDSEGITALRAKLAALFERIATLTAGAQTACRQALLCAVGDIFPNTTTTCSKATRTGTACQNSSSVTVGNIACLQHFPFSFSHSGEDRGVRGACSAPGCTASLGSANLGCLGCHRGICEDHYAQSTETVPDVENFQGVCAVCLAQNPALTELTFLLSNFDGASTGLLVFYHPDVDTLQGLSERLETYLLSPARYMVISPHLQLYYPPVQATPVRRARPAPLSPGGQTPSAGPPRPLGALLGAAGAAGLARAPIAATRPGTGPGMNIQPDQTTQGRLNDLTDHAAALSLQPQMTVADLLAALRQRNTSTAAPPGHATHAAGGAPPDAGTISHDVTQLIQQLGNTHVRSDTSLSDLAGTVIHPTFAKLITFLKSKNVHETGDLDCFSDHLGLGSTKLHQLLNQAVHGHPRADHSELYNSTPGKLGLVYSEDEGHTLMVSSQSERQYPTLADLTRWCHRQGEGLSQLRHWREGIFDPSHPHYAFAKKMINLQIGSNVLIHALLAAHMQAGHSFQVAYMASVFFYTDALDGISRATDSELQNRLITIGQADPVTQNTLAFHTTLFLNSTPHLTKATAFVQGNLANKKDKGKGGKPEREPPRDRTPGACPLCGKSNCPGYFAPNYSCTNPITTRCRLCNFAHARSGKRKSPCGAAEPLPASE